MKPFNSLIQDFQTLNDDTSSGTVGRMLLNLGIKKSLGLADWSFFKDTKNYSTGTSVQDYDYPHNANKIDYVHSWYGNRWYTPLEIREEERWRQITSVSVTSSIPQFWHISDETKKVSVYPSAADSKGTVKVGFTKKIIDFGASDYSTGSIAVSSGSLVFTGSGGASWGSIHIGRYLQIGSTTTLADGYWFEIGNVITTTSLTAKELSPSTFTAGSGTYKIVEMSPFPDGFEEIPLYFSLEKYYQIKRQPVLAREWERMYKESIESLLKRDGKTINDLVIRQDDILIYDVNENPWDMEIKNP